MSGNVGLRAGPREELSISLWRVVMGLVAAYVLAELWDGFSIGQPEAIGAAILRGPWLLARTVPFLFLLTLRRPNEHPFPLAIGLAAAQLFCAIYLDEFARVLVKAPTGFSRAQAIACLLPVGVAAVLWIRHREPLQGGLFWTRALVGAAAFVLLSSGPILTAIATALLSAPMFSLWR